MSCKCKKIHATITCTNCGSTQNLTYKERYTAQQAITMQGKKCKQCFNTDFTVQEIPQ